MQYPRSYTVPTPPAPRRIRFDALGEGWQWLQADMADWVLSVLLVSLITVIPFIGILGYLLVSRGLGSKGITSTNFTVSSNLVTIPTAVVGQLLATGLQRRAMLQVRGQNLGSFSERFSLNGMGPQVALFGLATGLLAISIQLPLELYARNFSFPQSEFIIYGSSLLLGMVTVLFMFTPLIIVDQKLTLIEAFKKCIQTFGPHYFPLLGLVVLTWLLSAIGLIACCVGILFTSPLVYTVVGMV